MEENVKAKTASRVKEKRPVHNQDGIPKKINKHQGLKTDLPQMLPPQPSTDGNSPLKKLFCEANKIVKIGMEKEYALLEREATLQNSNETIDNLRKNMLHLQMEYEKLDQNFQREVSYRTEIVKRMDATRELVESVVQCSNVLSASVKQLEDDKLKIAEYYELIYQKQKETEAKYIETKKLIKEQDELLKLKMQEINKFQSKIMTQNSETISQLSKKLSQANDKLKTATNENENLQRKIQDVEESSSRLQTYLEQQEKLNYLHQETVAQFKQNVKKMKIQRFKCQKLLKNNKKQLCAVVSKNKNLKKNLEKVELLYSESASIIKNLQLKDNEWEIKFGKHLEEDTTERQNWEAEKQELIDKLTDKQLRIDNLKEESESYSSKILQLTTNEDAKQKELEQMQNDLSKMLSENLKLKEDVAKITEDNDDKAKIISELEIKSSAVDAGLNSQLNFYKNECQELKDVVKNLESQLSDVQKRLAYEKALKKKEITDMNNKLENSAQESNKKIMELEKILEEKIARIETIETQRNQTAVDSKTTVNKLENELKLEKSKNKELNKNFGNLEESYNDVNKQLEEAKKQILDFEEKLRDLNTRNKTLNRNQAEVEKNVDKLKEEIELEKKSYEALEEKHKTTEKELAKMEKISQENSTLKSTTAELKRLLETTEVRLEAYKIAVKKLESEKIEAKNTHSEEVSKLRLELTRLEETIRKDKFLLENSQNPVENTQQNKREPDTPVTRTKGKLSSAHAINSKENEPEVEDKWHQVTSSPIQSGKKFLSTPRKILTSTPQTGFRNITPIQKKRDPYEFDSDSSVERFDQDKVLKVFNRQKRETTNKRSKTNSLRISILRWITFLLTGRAK